MTLLVFPQPGTLEAWRRSFAAAMPDLEVRFWPEIGNPADIDIAAMGGTPPAGAFKKLPNLQLILSLPAGIDTMLEDPDLPPVPIARTNDPDGDKMMNESVMMHVLRHHRYVPSYQQQQTRGEWKRLPITPANERKVGVMGLGMIGMGAAKALAALGFQVAGWVRQPRTDGPIEIFGGRQGLKAFLGRSEILVNLLPLTSETRDIIAADTLKMLPAGAAFINLGRGECVVEEDLIAALDSGHLAAATLDVYRVEPLPSDSPLWRHPKITVMPHVARRLLPEKVAPRVCGIVKDFRAGKQLAQLVDRKLGY